jgi:hypothetical protein
MGTLHTFGQRKATPPPAKHPPLTACNPQTSIVLIGSVVVDAIRELDNDNPAKARAALVKALSEVERAVVAS